MIPEVDQALRGIVREQALDGSDVEVVFDAPTKEWAARRNSPTVNLYLYDIREDVRRRERGWVEHRSPEGVVVARSPAPRHYKLSYLVTAWTQRPEDEHRLLDSLLRTFLRYEAMPPDLLADVLPRAGTPVPMTIGLPPPEDRAFADVWSALGGELKPSLDLVVVAPLAPDSSFAAGPPVLEGPILDAADTVDGGRERRQRHVPPDPSAARTPAPAPRTARGTRSARRGAVTEPGPAAPRRRGRDG